MRKFFSSTLILIAAITGTASAATPTTLLKLPATCSGTTLGELVACRLSISTLVGRDKYATGSAIEDKTREAVVITNGIKAGAPLGISEAAATSWWGGADRSQQADSARRHHRCRKRWAAPHQ
ncbi:hypothetical protein [Deinococcus gobiensis]|uniref:Uncharacterized protein n=1 Tax=Deinococcus gobiensis (strain DSM 21396 / JCM 16679 / CGMCC 1.7299 / I-0) TaxID=745776 RepID=H8H343_DEIGI|nr:hypothetical protein [Deinococcus gobiensis]AFD27940.1 hypothetical protein DGo_PC0148 [Deinococcus gobiensis I-0]